MQTKMLLVAVLLLFGLAAGTLEESLVHTDDGCIVETHCNACLLRLGTSGVVTQAFSLPLFVVALDRVAPALPPSHDDAARQGVPSRGPPRG
jgi:hypothetical protein